MGLWSGDLMMSPQLESLYVHERLDASLFLILERFECLDLRILLLKYSSLRLSSFYG